MCRFVPVFIFVTLVSCVLALDVPPTTENPVRICAKKPEVKNSQEAVKKCFNETVAHHLHGTVTGGCKNAADLEEPFKKYWATVHDNCNITISFNITNITKIIDYSLNNISFEKFYNGKDCLVKAENNISNACVKGKVGYFNITETRKHSTWKDKASLKYSSNTCKINEGVDQCVQVYLKDCAVDTKEYVAKLFSYVRDLGSCSQFPDPAAIPIPAGNTASDSWLTTPVIIALSVGAVVAGAAIITIMYFKCKK